MVSQKTWDDLNLDDFFEWADRTSSCVGRQYLYDVLHYNRLSEISEQEEVIRKLSADKELRAEIRSELRKLDTPDAYTIASLFSISHPVYSRRFYRLLTILQFAPFVLLGIVYITSSLYVLGILCTSVLVNMVLHYRSKARIQGYFFSIPQLWQLLRQAEKLAQIPLCASVHRDIQKTLQALHPLRKKLSTFRFSIRLESDIAIFAYFFTEIVNVFFLREVIPVSKAFFLLQGLLVVLLNITEVPNMLLMIFQGAFGIKEFVTGGTMGAVIWGMKRGLLTNEAGMGTAPNAGATATISHPAKQGYVQTLGVYFDTMMACTVTAFIVLLSNPAYGDKSRGASLTQSALAMQLGDWAVHFLTIAIFLFAFSTVIGNYYYGESNMRFVTENKVVLMIFRVLVLVFVFFGAISSLDLVWTTADMLNAGMVIVNLTAVLLMTPKVVAVLKNYEAQRKAGLEPIFRASDLPEIKNLAAWDGTDVVTTREFWAEYDAKTAERRKLKAAKKAAKAGR